MRSSVVVFHTGHGSDDERDPGGSDSAEGVGGVGEDLVEVCRVFGVCRNVQAGEIFVCAVALYEREDFFSSPVYGPVYDGFAVVCLEVQAHSRVREVDHAAASFSSAGLALAFSSVNVMGVIPATPAAVETR